MAGPDVTLEALGWDERRARSLSRVVDVDDDAIVGRVSRIDRGLATVLTTTGERRASLAPSLRGSPSEALPVVGDWVVVEPRDDRDGPADDVAVTAVLERSSAFVRGDPGRAGATQVVAANVDTIFLVHALGREPNPRRIERELVLAWQSGATPVVVLNKADLASSAPDVERAVGAVSAIAPGVEVRVASCVGPPGVETLRRDTGPGRTGALIGPSGVGKSTIVNRLVGDDVQTTGAVRDADQRGRHVTVARELLALPSGGWLIDTPGLRAVGLVGDETGLARAFVDIEALAVRCAFRDCRHDAEPGCALTAAVGDGRLDPTRLESYRNLRDEIEQVARTREAGR